MGRCTCICQTPGIAFIPIDGAFFCRSYAMTLFCSPGSLSIGFRNDTLGNVWLGHLGFDEEFQPIPVTIPCGAGTRDAIAILTVHGTGRGQVEVKIVDAGDTDVIIARWISRTAWQPHCYVQMLLQDFDRSCRLDWDPRPCLRVSYGNPRCLCNGDAWAFRVSYALHPRPIEWWREVFPDNEELAQLFFDDTAAYCAYFSMTDWVCDVDTLIAGGGCGGIARREPGVPYMGMDGPTAAPYAEVWVYFDADGFGNYSLHVSPGAPYWGVFPLEDDGGPNPSWCLEGPWTGEVPIDEEAVPSLLEYGYTGSVTVSAIRLQTTRSGYVSPGCVVPTYNVCQGGSAHRVVREATRPGKAVWKWQLVSSSCTNWCPQYGVTCVPTIPTDVVLPDFEITDEEAEGLGLTAIEDEVFVGGCGCVSEYQPPVAPCTGDSWHTLERVLCSTSPTTKHLYRWRQDSTSCAGSCVCRATIPYELLEEPIDEETAEARGYLDDLGRSIQGSCECGAEIYEPPECPTCECEDIDGATFTFDEPDGSAFNGVWNLTPDAAPCEEPGCCFGREKSGDGTSARLTYHDGVWTLHLQAAGAFATYTLAAGVCTTPLTMNLQSVSGDSAPSTLTVALSI